MLIATLFFGGIFFSMFFFMKGKISETVSKEDEIKTEIEKGESLSFMQKSVEENQVNEDKVTGYFIPSNGTASFIKVLENIVASSSLKSQVNSINYEPSSDLSAINAEFLDVKISVAGTWSNLNFFLKLLENYPLKINIRSASLKQFTTYTVGGKQIPQWSGDIDFTVVKFKDN